MLRFDLLPHASLSVLAGVMAACGLAQAQSARLVPLDGTTGAAPEFALLPAAAATSSTPAAAPRAQTAPEPATAAIEQPSEPGVAQPVGTTSADTSLEVPSGHIEFGAAGSEWWTVGGGVAVGRRTHVDGNIYGAWSHFLADDVEFAAELGVWYYNQEDDDAVGINPNIVFRWHFVHEEDFTVYADIGIGILGATDNVPSNGTSFDFTPRAGLGFTYALNDAGDLRLVGGLRWAHVSNARIHGDDDNPGLDTIMLYSGVQFPF